MRFMLSTTLLLLALLTVAPSAVGLGPQPPPGSKHKAHTIPGYYLCLPLYAPTVCYYVTRHDLRARAVLKRR